jgi:hypothetical protein
MFELQMKAHYMNGWSSWGKHDPTQIASARTQARNWVEKATDSPPIETRLIAVETGEPIAHFVKRDGKVVDLLNGKPEPTLDELRAEIKRRMQENGEYQDILDSYSRDYAYAEGAHNALKNLLNWLNGK